MSHGMNPATGRWQDELSSIKASVHDIITTPIGSRPMRRDYGSLVPELIDHPWNAANRLRLQAATVMAILRWEDRVAPESVEINTGMDGRGVLDFAGTRTAGPRAGTAVNFSTPLR